MKDEAKVAIARLDRAIATIEVFGSGYGSVSIEILRDVRDLIARIVEDKDELRSD